MAVIGKRQGHNRGVKCIMSAIGHRRGDKYLFANQKRYHVKSYRAMWLVSRTKDDFEVWLAKQGLLAA